MSTDPLVSVVVPAYRNARYVARTLDSVLRQTYRHLDVVVADHSSDDGTWERLQPYADDPRVRLLRTEAGGGAERNWNRVTDEARGELVKLVCGDDLLAPTCLERQVAALRAEPGAVLAACRRDLVDPADRVLVRGRGLGPLRGRVPGAQAVRATVRAGTNLLGEPACVLLRTDVVRAVGGWSARDPYLIDQDLYVRALRHGDLVALDEVLAAFRVSATQWSVALAGEQARQAARLHARVHADWPEAVSAADARLGSLRAVGTAGLRRAAYLVWSRRMRAAPGSGGGVTDLPGGR
ncbi:glycosyltransferase family 2 protein [Aquipuribacter sp. SD81]|uniref:glycosyltransferase family 2 protein n=1 Tax=Aquipuribacter sp. SD81 TaxID=3127703 RepID=UPI00301695E9